MHPYLLLLCEEKGVFLKAGQEEVQCCCADGIANDAKQQKPPVVRVLSREKLSDKGDGTST